MKTTIASDSDNKDSRREKELQKHLDLLDNHIVALLHQIIETADECSDSKDPYAGFELSFIR
jgi:hypothetical protein